LKGKRDLIFKFVTMGLDLNNVLS